MLHWYHFRLWIYARIGDLIRPIAPLSVYRLYCRLNPVGRPHHPHTIDFEQEY